MRYLIIGLITIVSIVISTLVTQSWGWGLVLWGLLGIIIGLSIFVSSGEGGVRGGLGTKKKHKRKKLSIALGIRLLAGIVTMTRLRARDLHCRQAPDMIQGAVTVDSVWQADRSYVVTQGSYNWIYRTSDQLIIGDRVILYSTIDKLQSCLSTYTHWDVGTRRLSSWVGGGDFDYDRWLAMKGMDGYVQGKNLTPTLSFREGANEVILSGENGDSISNLTNFKNHIIEQITTLFRNPRSAGRVGGTLIGTKDLINKSDYDLLIGSGLVHLIVVSGGNLALVILVLGAILFRVPLYIRYLLIGVGLIGYVMIVGPDSSVLRALCMAIMTILGIIAGRKRSFGGMLSIATIVLILYNPMMIYDVGLRLSLGAVIGIYLTYHEVSRLTYQRDRKRWIQGLRQVLLVVSASIGAWLGTLPVLIWQFGSANLTSIIANSVTGIIASITTIAELIVISLSSIAPGATKLLIKGGVRIVDQLVAVIYHIATLTVQWGVWIGVSDQWGMILIVGSILILFVLLYHHTQKMRVEYLLEMESDVGT